jgi:pyruvate dehydrogenase E2 component (dihydrolipoamide acetyltransferase)
VSGLSGNINLIEEQRGLQIYRIEGLQKVMAEVFVKNWPRTPVVHIGVQVNVGPADAFRRRHGEAHGVRVSMMTMIQKCVAMAAVEYPLIAGLFDGEDTLRVIVPRSEEIAVSGPVMIGDTAIPVLIERASVKSLTDIAAEMTATVDDLKSRVLDRSDAEAGFHKLATIPNVGISNLGMMGEVNFVTAMSIAPSLCALYAAAMIQTPIVDERGAIVAAPVINFCMAFDHRVLAGGPVAQYLDRFKKLMERPEALENKP